MRIHDQTIHICSPEVHLRTLSALHQGTDLEANGEVLPLGRDGTRLESLEKLIHRNHRLGVVLWLDTLWLENNRHQMDLMNFLRGWQTHHDREDESENDKILRIILWDNKGRDVRLHRILLKFLHQIIGARTLEWELAWRSLRDYLEVEMARRKMAAQMQRHGRDLLTIHDINKALATEKDFDRLVDLILQNARTLVQADGGSIYLVEEGKDKHSPPMLRFMRSALLLDADEFVLPIDSNSIAGHVAASGKPLILNDVHQIPAEAPYSFNSAFDEAHDYYTKSMMVVPMTNQANEIIGVIQLINKKRDFEADLTAEEMKGGAVISFTQRDYDLLHGVAGQAAVAIDNQRLLNDQRRLLESFIELIAQAIDSKSEYTGGHCERVPVITEMLAQAACDEKEGPFAEFQLDDEQWYELRIAAGLHDCGKIVTPVHVMDKATKLETIFDRIVLVQTRFEVLRRDAWIQYYRQLAEPREGGSDLRTLENRLKADLENRLEQLSQWQNFIEEVNIGGEFLADEKLEKIQEIGREVWEFQGEEQAFLSEDELMNLSIRKGTLTEQERLIINGHMVETVRMLENLPFPKNLRRVPEYAGGHHEKMDGNGYPKGLFAGDMSIPARIMAIADVFEALTALDRPYKKGKTLSETMRIMGFMKQDNHLDPDLFDLFVRSGVYRVYGQKFLPAELIDEVDEESLLKIKPKSFELPTEEVRQTRWEDFLPEYRNLRPGATNP